MCVHELEHARSHLGVCVCSQIPVYRLPSSHTGDSIPNPYGASSSSIDDTKTPSPAANEPVTPITTTYALDSGAKHVPKALAVDAVPTPVVPAAATVVSDTPPPVSLAAVSTPSRSQALLPAHPSKGPQPLVLLPPLPGQEGFVRTGLHIFPPRNRAIAAATLFAEHHTSRPRCVRATLLEMGRAATWAMSHLTEEWIPADYTSFDVRNYAKTWTDIEKNAANLHCGVEIPVTDGITVVSGVFAYRLVFLIRNTVSTYKAKKPSTLIGVNMKSITSSNVVRGIAHQVISRGLMEVYFSLSTYFRELEERYKYINDMAAILINNAATIPIGVFSSQCSVLFDSIGTLTQERNAITRVFDDCMYIMRVATEYNTPSFKGVTHDTYWLELKSENSDYITRAVSLAQSLQSARLRCIA